MSPKIIKTKIEQYFEIGDISENNRSHDYVLARLFYFKATYKNFYPNISHKKIAETIRRHHSTSIHYQQKTLTTQEAVLFSHFERTKLNASEVIQEQIKTKKTLVATNAGALIKNYNGLKKQISALQKQKQGIDIIPSKLVKTLLELPESTRNDVLERFQIIADMESRKVYSYAEKRNKNGLK